MIAIPLMWKIGGAVAAVALVVGGLVWLDSSRQAIGYNKAKAEYAIEELRATHDARIQERLMYLKVTEAQNAAKVRETKHKAATVILNNELSRLLFDLEEAARNLPGLTADATRIRAAAVGTILGECAKEITGLAGKADGHASDSLMLQQAWPK